MGEVAAEGAATSPRLAAIDVARGVASLWVLMIHAGAMEGEPLMVYLFNRAAPIFVVLMGLNAGLWWRRRGPADVLAWWTGRARRLYPPMWPAVAAFWLMAVFAPRAARGDLGWRRLARNALGWLEGVGTGWFVTLAIEYAILLPLLVLAVRKIGVRRALLLAVLTSAACFLARFPLVARLGMFGWFAFPPRLLANLVFGMALVPVVSSLGARDWIAAAGVCSLYFALPPILGPHSPWQLVPDGIGLGASGASAAAYRLLDLPVTVLLLGASALIVRMPLVAVPLEWLGVRSYGVYLGQMVAHNAVALFFGTDAFRAAFGASALTVLLLAGALAWIASSRVAGDALRGLRARPSAGLARRAALLAFALLGASSPAVAGPRPLVLFVGDSTTAGMCEGCPPSPAASPATALEQLRARLPEGSRWRDLRAVSAGVGGSTTADWIEVKPEVCRYLAAAGARGRDRVGSASAANSKDAAVATPVPADLGARALAAACETGGGLGAAVRRLLGERPDLVMVVLGANDVMNRVAPETYVANLRAIAAGFAPARVLIATPFWSPQPERAGLAAYAEALRAAGLVGGPDFQVVHLPVDGLGVHLTRGGYAAAGALWLDALPR